MTIDAREKEFKIIIQQKILTMTCQNSSSKRDALQVDLKT
jgi:hypothetical protein